MRALPVVAAGRLGVVTLAELLAAGWTVAAVRHAVATGRLERIGPSRFAPSPPTSLNRFERADLALARRAVAAAFPLRRTGVSHLGAAWLRGWPIWAPEPHPCATTVDRRVCRLPGVHLHHGAAVSDFEFWRGMPVTTAARTIVDVAREFGVEAALVSGDAALHRRDLDLRELTAAVDGARGLVGVDQARALITLLDALSESPLESRGRYRCHVHGVPPTHSQVRILTSGGRFVARVDHYWDIGVVGEADGSSKYRDDPLSLPREKRRQQALEDLDLEVVRWGAPDLVDFTAAEARIRRAVERARRKRADGPPTWIATTGSGMPIPTPALWNRSA